MMSLAPFVRCAIERGATDILLTVGAPVFLRVGNVLEPIDGDVRLGGNDVAELISSVLEPAQRTAFEQDREIDFSYSWQGQVRLRANAFVQRGEPAMALRIIPEVVPTMSQIGLPSAAQCLTELPQGLILVTGPTGSGKSTTQAAMIDSINERRACHILTIEDPIEYVHRHKKSAVSQREIGTDSWSFERALRSALREDPDVLLVGEMRDAESIATALTIAETGHLVISTLHTNDAAQAIDRIVDVFPGDRQAQIRVQLAGSLAGVIAQRLLPSVGGGLIAAFEVMIATPSVSNLIREGKSRQLRNVILTGAAHGMQTLEMSLNALVAAGQISHDEATARALHPAEISGLPVSRAVHQRR
jgi:twitching motility protein PilT